MLSSRPKAEGSLALGRHDCVAARLRAGRSHTTGGSDIVGIRAALSANRSEHQSLRRCREFARRYGTVRKDHTLCSELPEAVTRRHATLAGQAQMAHLFSSHSLPPMSRTGRRSQARYHQLS